MYPVSTHFVVHLSSKPQTFIKCFVQSHKAGTNLLTWHKIRPQGCLLMGVSTVTAVIYIRFSGFCVKIYKVNVLFQNIQCSSACTTNFAIQNQTVLLVIEFLFSFLSLGDFSNQDLPLQHKQPGDVK